jgi:hypothetical protein
MATRKNLQPPTTVESQSLERFMMNKNSMSARQFREAITKAGPSPSVPGVKTNTANWGRWSP